MSRTTQNLILAGGLGVVALISLFNAVQLDRLEGMTIDNGKRMKALESQLAQGVTVAGGASTGGRAAATTSACDETPGNLLACPAEPRITAATVAPGQTLRYQNAQDPRGLNPMVANGADVYEFSKYTTDYLGERRPSDPDVWEQNLATSITTRDNKTFVVTLREGVYWHLPTVDWDSGDYDWLKGDGPGGRHALVADDLVFALDIIKNSQTSGRVSSLKNYFEQMSSWRAVDDHTVEIVFDEVLFTNLPSIADLWPMPRWLYMYDEQGEVFPDATWGLKFNEHWYNQKAIGVGPYQFVAWEPGVKLEFERNPLYWGSAIGNTPPYDRILIPIVKDQQAWVRKLKAGELDITQIQPEQYATEVKPKLPDGPFLGNEHVVATTHDTLGYFYLGWNADKPMFADKKVRQALTMALDRPGIVDNIFHGLGTVTTGPFGQQQPCYDHAIQPWPYDLDRARQQLEAAGWTDTDGDGIRDRVIDGEKVDFEFTMLIYGSSNEWETLAGVYREDLLSIGVKMTPSAVEWSTMLKKMDEREFDVYSGAWVLGWDADLMQIWHSQEADKAVSSNRIGFRNADADRIAEALRRELDPDKRLSLCREFHALVHEEQPYTFIYQRERPVLYWDHMNTPPFQKNYPYRDLRYFSHREASPF
ncbi:MAG: hypothetical protein H6742_01510 [Alphaproteobacteria bacterium]|nr:hypothetical protein [Alphaproteobacteria bacterium]